MLETCLLSRGQAGVSPGGQLQGGRWVDHALDHHQGRDDEDSGVFELLDFGLCGQAIAPDMHQAVGAEPGDLQGVGELGDVHQGHEPFGVGGVDEGFHGVETEGRDGAVRPSAFDHDLDPVGAFGLSPGHPISSLLGGGEGLHGHAELSAVTPFGGGQDAGGEEIRLGA